MSASKEKLTAVGSHSHGHTNHRPLLMELASFCVFNSSLGPREGEEHKKILFYYPLHTDIDVQIRHIGLMEAVCKFIQSFSDNDCRSLLTSQQLHVLLQAENGFWIAMSLNVMRIPDPLKSSGDDIERTREEQPQDDIYYIVLEKSYRMYKMMHGLMTKELIHSGVKTLKNNLMNFFGDYLSKISFGHHDVLHLFEAMSYLPMDRKSFLNVQSFINLLLINFKEVKHILLLYWDLLVWNDLDLLEAQTATEFVTRFLIPDQLEKDMQAIHLNAAMNQFSSQGHLGRFHFGPHNLWAPEASYSPTTVFLTNPTSDCVDQHEFIIYSASGSTICLFLEGVHQNPIIEYYRKLDIFLGPAMTSLALNLADQCSKLKNPLWSYDSPFVHYIYINDANLSKKQTVVDRTQSIQVELLKALSSIDEDLKSRPDDAEIFAKVLHDCWVYGRRTFDKRLFAVITQRNADLEIAEEEIRKLCAKEFPVTYDTYPPL